MRSVGAIVGYSTDEVMAQFQSAVVLASEKKRALKRARSEHGFTEDSDQNLTPDREATG